jgi:hypothetical protein
MSSLKCAMDSNSEDVSGIFSSIKNLLVMDSKIYILTHASIYEGDQMVCKL